MKRRKRDSPKRDSPLKKIKSKQKISQGRKGQSPEKIEEKNKINRRKGQSR